MITDPHLLPRRGGDPPGAHLPDYRPYLETFAPGDAVQVVCAAHPIRTIIGEVQTWEGGVLTLTDGTVYDSTTQHRRSAGHINSIARI